MREKLSNYLSRRLVELGITQNFSVTGGGAMHLNDAFGHQEGMYTLYQHHEQACAMAAEAYARIYNRPALLCVTTGPGGTNAITGVLGAWLDSLPMMVISGQVRYDNTAHWSRTGIRAMGDQEYAILDSVTAMTKFQELLIDPYRVRYVLEKAVYLMQTGRPGPVWLDIPTNVQGFYLETDDLIGFNSADYEQGGDGFCKSELLKQERAQKHPETASSLQHYYAPEEEKLRVALADELSEKENPHLLPGDSGTKTEKPETEPEKLLSEARFILRKIRESQRPIFYTGNGIRIAGAERLFLEVMEQLNLPVVVSWNAPDIIPTAHPLYVGRPGGRGDRPGNLAVQNADFILSIGSRLNIRQVGYRFRSWAREAYVIVNDIDREEMKKPSVHVDHPIFADAKALLQALLLVLKEEDRESAVSVDGERRTSREACGEGGKGCVFCGGRGLSLANAEKVCHTESAGKLLRERRAELIQRGGEPSLNWLESCMFYRENYPTVLPEYLMPSRNGQEPANVYAVVDILSRLSRENQITVVGNGSPCVAGGQAYRIKEGARFISQDSVASMGYDLPAAIGVSAAVFGPDAKDTLLQGEKNPYWAGRGERYPEYQNSDILLLTGDGSIQMNLQELQTIIHHRMPIKIFVINNGGYHSIRQTQNSYFGKPLVGIGIDSGVNGVQDLSFPDMGKLAEAYGYPFVRVSRNEELEDCFRDVLSKRGPVICEIMVSLEQQFLPKSAAKKLPDGSLVSPPLEDMAPYLPEEEMERIMLIPRE